MHLPLISSSKGRYSLLALDKPIWLAEQLELNYDLPEAKKFLDELLAFTLQLYSPYVTGISYAPESQLSALVKKQGGAGVIFPIERTSIASDPYSLPILHSKWGIEHIRNNYGVAKLALSVSPDEKELPAKLQLVSELYDSCHYEDIDFLLELHLLPDDDASRSVLERYNAVLRLFRRYCHLIAIEFPGSVVDTLSVAGNLESHFILINNQSNYLQAKEQLRDSMAAGGVGMLISNSVWPKGKQFGTDMAKARAFLQTEGLDRLRELVRIIDEG